MNSPSLVLFSRILLCCVPRKKKKIHTPCFKNNLVHFKRLGISGAVEMQNHRMNLSNNWTKEKQEWVCGRDLEAQIPDACARTY